MIDNPKQLLGLVEGMASIPSPSGISAYCGDLH